MNRAQRLAQIVALRDGGLTTRQIAAEVGLKPSGVRSVLNDPDGSKQKNRRERYRKPCPRCGTLMDGSNGYKSGPRLCSICEVARLRALPMIHGSTAAYARGCRCRPCRATIADRAREWYAAHRQEQTERNKKKYDPAKHHIYWIVNRAVRGGELVPPKSCEGCGDAARQDRRGGRWLHAHHDDYTKPLEVRWLCPPCHKAVHKQLREEAAA